MKLFKKDKSEKQNIRMHEVHEINEVCLLKGEVQQVKFENRVKEQEMCKMSKLCADSKHNQNKTNKNMGYEISNYDRSNNIKRV